VDADIALLALACRVAEGVLGAASFRMPRLLWLATAGADAPDPATASALGEFLLMPSFSTPIGATFFAVGSALFAYLLLRGHLISVPLAWLGIVGSVLLVAGLPLELTGLIGSPWTGLMWAPLAVFEVVFGLWLILKGVTTRSAPAVTTLPTQHAL